MPNAIHPVDGLPFIGDVSISDTVGGSFMRRQAKALTIMG